MKHYFLALCAILLLASCDDGDLIVTNFVFDDNNFDWCTGHDDRQVFFKTNNELSNEAIAIVFNLEPFNEDFLFEESKDSIIIPLNAENYVVYRTFNGEVNDDYFCNEIPPVSPVVLEEYRSTSGGEIIIRSRRNNLEDLDEDGVPTAVENAVIAENYVIVGEEEFPDSDGDGIPNFLDIDDDGDNVRTSLEIDIDTENTAEGFPDSDGDGIPNYLDPDDDNDDTLTIYEDWNENGTPTDDRNDEGIPYYLDPEIVTPFDAEPSDNNVITVSYRYFVYVDDLTLARQGGESEQVRLGEYEFGFINSGSEDVNLFDEPEEEEDSEEEPVE